MAKKRGPLTVGQLMEFLENFDHGALITLATNTESIGSAFFGTATHVYAREGTVEISAPKADEWHD